MHTLWRGDIYYEQWFPAGAYRTENNIISPYMFAGQHFDTLKLPLDVTRIGEGAFYNSNIPTIEIPQNVTVIDYEAFFSSESESIKLPEKLVQINERAFTACENLKTINIPNSVQSIAANAF